MTLGLPAFLKAVKYCGTYGLYGRIGQARMPQLRTARYTS